MDSRKMSLNDGDIESPVTMPDGTIKYQFNHAAALGILFINNVVVMKDGQASAFVESKGCFGVGQNEAFPLYVEKIELLYVLWKRDPIFGAIAWLIAETVGDPIPSVEKAMIEAKYDLDFIKTSYKDHIVGWTRTGFKHQ